MGALGQKRYGRRSMEEFIAVGDITDGIAAGLRGRAPSKEIPVHLELPEDSEDDVAMGLEQTLHARERPRTETAKS